MSATMTANTKAAACCCPVCRGLELFEAPKYATGAILLAEDLSSEQAFVRAKMRLHNRHLHGWGTVCGLKVVCDDCEGSVRIEPGYAIDPCGNDIVLAESTRFDIVKAIRDCRDAKRPKLGDCDPFVVPPDPGCRDVETHWCVTLKFNEVESGHAVSLGRQPAPKGGCGCSGHGACGCGSGGGRSGGSTGCGCGGSYGATVVTQASSAALGYTLPGCAPRRIVECVEFGIVPHDGPCQPQWRRDPIGVADNRLNPNIGFGLGDLVAPDSLLGRMIACFRDAYQLLTARLTSTDSVAIGVLLNNDPLPAGLTARQIRDALCRLRQAVLDFLYRHDPVRCQVLRTMAELTIPELGQQESAAAYLPRARPVAQNLGSVFLQGLADCMCGAFLPRCADDPCDMRVPIACVTVRGDRIISICNHSCRRYAGAFPSLFYWTSAIPIVPLIGKLIASICCAPDAVTRNSPVVNHLLPIVERLNPSGSWLKALAGNGFAMPKAVVDALGSLDLASLFAGAMPAADAVAPASVVGKDPKSAVAELKRKGVDATLVPVDDPDAPEVKLGTIFGSITAEGRSARLYTHGGRVVGVALGGRPAGPEVATPAYEHTPAANEELAALRREVSALREEVAAMRGDPK